MRHLLEKIEELFRAVAPELYALPHDPPVYVILANDLPKSFAGFCKLHGSTTPLLGMILKPELQAQRRWRGPGCAIIVSPRAVADVRRHRTRAHRKQVVVGEILGVALHELAHAVDPYFLAAIDDLEDHSPAYIAFAKLIVEQTAPMPPGPTGHDLHGHCWQFVRACLHLAHRARAAGVDVDDASVCTTSEYGLSPTFRYASALGDEPQRLDRCGFREIWDTPPPEEFARLWRKDLLARLLPVKSKQELKKKLAGLDRREMYTPTQQEN